MPVINMTPHAICIIHTQAKEQKKVEIIPFSGHIARCEVQKVSAGLVEDIPIYNLTYGAVVNLPPVKTDTFYIVSNIVAQSLRNVRNDLLVPVDFVRNSQGEIIGCQGLGRLSE